MILRLVPALAAALLAAGAARAAPPWEDAPFSAAPEALRAAAEALPRASGPVDVLVDEATWRFDARGAATVVRRVVYRALTAEAARAEGRVDASWAPWHEARPELRARVVAGGEVAELSPAAVADSPLAGSERRLVSAALPGVREGAIVEQVITTRETAPLFDGGVVSRFRLAGTAPARLVRLRLEAPAALPLRAVVRGASLTPRETVKDGQRTIVVERRDVPATAAPAPGTPREIPSVPEVAFSWGRSWADVAARYGAVVDGRIAGADLAAALGEALGGGARPARAETIRRVLAFVRARVKVTWRAVGDAPLAPAAPRDVLARGEGDPQAVAALTVALLRAAGLDAQVALVSTEREEVPPALPGLGLLDRPVVRVEGASRAPATWLDPADPSAAPGRVTIAADGRLALVAGKGTRALVAAPAARPEDNAALTVRTLLLAELGAGRLVETREVTGALAASERAFRAALAAADHRGVDARYARDVLGGTLVAEEHEEQDDRLRRRIEVDGSAAVVTGDDEASVDAAPDGVFEPLPPFLGVGAEAEPPPRTQDVELAIPYRYELRYRIVPAEGFRARPLPADAAERFGPVSFARRFVLEKDGSVTATYRLDTGARRLAARDADALARRARELVRSDGPRVAFERTSSALIAEGRVPEALAEIRRLVALHPREAMHHLHLALALVGLGYTESAAEEARRGIALEPDRAWAQRVLGWVLEHDAVGRLRGPGFDRDGALAAYGRARTLDPKNAGGRAALASLLAHRGSSADLASAIEELRAAREGDRPHAHDGLLVAVLFAAGRDAEAGALARALPSSPERDAVLVATAAIAEGIDRAETEAAALGDVARAALANASSLLVGRRRLALAARLAEAAARGAPNAAELRGRAEMLAAVRPWEQVKDEGDEAARLVKRLLVVEATSRAPTKDVAALLARRVRAGKVREALLAGLALPLEARGALPAPGPTADVTLDVALSQLELAREGDAERGLRLRVRWRSAPAAPPSSLYVARERGALRIVATDRAWPLLGAEALRCTEAGDLAGAGRWLAWAREDAPGEAGDVATPAGLVAALAPAGAPLDLASARAAAAALLSVDDARGELLAPLREARARAQDPARARGLATAIAAAAVAADRPGDGLAAAEDLLALDPASRKGFAVKAWALRRLGRGAELDGAAEKVLAHRPEDAELLGALASAKLLLGDYDGAAATFRRLIDGGRATPGVYNDAAWVELFRGGASPTVLDWARRAADGAGPGEHAALNTLAAVHASLGRAAEAREVFLRSLADERPLEGADWFVFGRIAEGWGLDAAARAAYARVEEEKVDGAPDPSDAKVLARRRLERMGAPVPVKDEGARRGGR